MKARNFFLIPLLLSALPFLQACGDGEDAFGQAGSGNDSGALTVDQALSGSVGDGPVIHADLRFWSSSGELLHTLVGDAWATYSAEFRTQGRHYPLLIDATGGTDLVTNAPLDFTLYSTLLSPRSNATANLNPFSTLAIVTAQQAPGGLSAGKLADALDAVVRQFNSGLTTLADDPMTKPIDHSNLAEIVKSSEILAEVFRRTWAATRATIPAASIDDVVLALGADLVDGILDGRGASAADAQISAAAVVANAQVVLEAMTGALLVNGVPATALLEAAILQVSAGAVDARMSSLPVTAEMIHSARVGVAAAYAIAPSEELATLYLSLDDLAPGMASDATALVLSDHAPSLLEPALLAIAAGDASDMQVVNTIAAGAVSGPEPEANSPPTISGNPATSVLHGHEYRFTPSAMDPEGDELSFSISNRPSWARFDASTGALSGTPGAADIGTYTGISIHVSDGEYSASLPAFAIEVQAVALGTATLSWEPPTENEDGTPLLDLAGYVIDWGASSGTYNQAVVLHNPGMSTYVVDGLPSGTHYFVIRAYNAVGVHSRYSSEASIRIP